MVRGILSALGVVLGAQFFAGCTSQQAKEGPTGTSAEALSGLNVISFDKIEGTGGLREASTLTLTANQIAVVTGYWAAGDGGGGIFYWDPTLPGGTDDGGTVIVAGAGVVSPGTVGQCWRRVYSGPVSVRWFGAKGDGTSPAMGDGNSARIKRAVEHVAAISGGGTETPGGIVEFPGGKYYCAEPIVFDYQRNVVWKGPAEINYTGTASDFITLKGITAWSFDDLIFTYDNAGFMGSIFQTAGGSADNNDTINVHWNRCIFHGWGVNQATACLAIDHTVGIIIRDCSFSEAMIGIRGQKIAPANQVTVAGCIFSKLVTSSIYNSGEAWTIIGNSFNPTSDGQSRGAFNQDLDDPHNAYDFLFQGNYCGDGGGGSAGPWIRVKGYGVSICGNAISCVPSGNTVVHITGTQGISICGNFIRGVVEFTTSAGYSSGAMISGNVQIGGPVKGVTEGFVSTLNMVGNSGFTLADNLNVLTLPLKMQGPSGEATLWRNQIYSLTWTPGIIPAGGYVYTNAPDYPDGISVPGARLGDAVAVGISPELPAGVVISAQIRADHYARLTIQNLNGLPVSLLDSHTIQLQAISGFA